MSRTAPRTRRRATAVAEFALLSPVLLSLVVGIWEYGRLVEVQQLVTNAAREAGRQVATGNRSPTEVQQAVADYLARAGVPTPGLSTTLINYTDSSRADPRDAVQLDRYRVTVTLPFNNVRWILLNLFPVPSTLTATADWYSMNDVPLTVSTTIPVE